MFFLAIYFEWFIIIYMNKKIKFSASFIIILLSFISVYSTSAEEDVNKTNDRSVACTMDAKLCPDGTSVGRTGPDCKFICPGLNEGMKRGGEIKDKFKEVKGQMEVKKEDVQNKREEVKNEVEKIKTELEQKREENKTKMETLVESAKLKREEMKKEFELKKEEVKNKIQEVKLTFKDDIKKIKDENKQISAEKIFTTIQELNTKITTSLSAKLDQIENSLISVESRITKAENAGIDTTLAKGQVEKAKLAITTAREAVLVQSSKVYEVNITDEIALKAEMKKLRDTFKTDINAVNVKIKNAHIAVRTVATSLAKIPKIDDENETKVENNNTTTNTN